MSGFESDSRALVPAHGDAKGFDKQHMEKWLVYCPALDGSTLLYLVTALESYSLRTYGGRFGVKTTGMHAEGAHTASEFMTSYAPEKILETTLLEKPVTDTAFWSEFVAKKYASFLAKAAGQ